ncbi:hypothetical protein H8K32_05905 [Undibacterium jejuense]|uniref:Porin n=1 Tax=Undibacterium jejuense TaxID=1344949 RepID=A0A923KK97_9BURK|nr:hypothetical protein [Undibacterium jejuense]MBC3861630.1 hypothetical protein [Undibacterium jejuense]
MFASPIRLILLYTLSLPALWCSSHSFAQTNNNDVSISGFGTLGVVHNDTRQVDIIRNLSQNNGVGFTRQTDVGMDSNLGLQVDGRFSDTLDGAIQVISRRNPDQFHPQLSWAYLRYLPNDNLTIRTGRLGFDAYMLADSKNVGYSYIWIRPPIDFFGSLILSYFDGADLRYTHNLEDGKITSKFFSGIAREKLNTGYANQILSLAGSKLLGGHVEFEQDYWTSRLSYSVLQIANEYPRLTSTLGKLQSPAYQTFIPNGSTIASELSLQNKLVRYTALGIVYDNSPFLGQFMLNDIHSDSLIIPHSRAGFLTLSYRINKWTPYSSLSAVRPIGGNNITTTPGMPPSAVTLINRINRRVIGQENNQTTFTTGIRYDLTNSSNIKVQIDQIHNIDHLLVRNVQPGWNGHANLISASYNFIF